VDDQVQHSGVKASADWERLEDVRLDRGDVEPSEAPGNMAQDVPVRVDDRHLAPVGEARPIEEVAGAGTDIEVSGTDVLPVALQQSFWDRYGCGADANRPPVLSP
jgi:hypothetical protein